MADNSQWLRESLKDIKDSVTGIRMDLKDYGERITTIETRCAQIQHAKMEVVKVNYRWLDIILAIGMLALAAWELK